MGEKDNFEGAREYWLDFAIMSSTGPLLVWVLEMHFILKKAPTPSALARGALRYSTRDSVREKCLLEIVGGLEKEHLRDALSLYSPFYETLRFSKSSLAVMLRITDMLGDAFIRPVFNTPEVLAYYLGSGLSLRTSHNSKELSELYLRAIEEGYVCPRTREDIEPDVGVMTGWLLGGKKTLLTNTILLLREKGFNYLAAQN